MTEPSAVHKSGYVALIGRPNSGKSTLLNTVVGEQLSIVTALPQTTRRNLRGILTTENMQVIFVDTPGIHKGKYTFNEMMIREARGVLKDTIDLVCYLVDLSRELGEEEKMVAEIVAGSGKAVIVVFNKIDTCTTPDEKIEQFFRHNPSLRDKPAIRLSALDPKSKASFIEAITPFIPEGPRYYSEDDLTDANLRFFAAEYVRKHIILNTHDEVPHAAFVEVESYKESPTEHGIDVTIHVETIGQRGILVGKKGSIITRIRKGAERDLERLVQVPVRITCHIKVTPKWRDNQRFLHDQGFGA